MWWISSPNEAVLQTVIKEKPENPYDYMARQGSPHPSCLRFGGLRSDPLRSAMALGAPKKGSSMSSLRSRFAWLRHRKDL